MKEKLQQIGAGIFILAFIYLSVVLTRHAAPLNLATWVLWTLLDSVLTREMYKCKHPFRHNMAALTTGAGVVAVLAIVQLSRGETALQWGAKETLTLTCFLAIFGIRHASNSEKLTVNLGTTGMFIAGMPSLLDAWQHPENTDAIFWGLCTLGSVVNWIGSEKGFTARYMPVGGTVFNGLIAALAMRLIK